MPISTLQSNSKFSLKDNKFFTYVFMVFGLAIIFFLGSKLIDNVAGSKAKSALSAEVMYGDAEVSLNGNFIGVTPFETRDIAVGDNKVTVKSKERQYDLSVGFLPNSQVVIKRDLGVSDLFSSGYNMWFEKSPAATSLSVISEPSEATVFLDNSEVGKTPYSSNNLTEGDYDLRIEYTDYEPQSVRISVKKGFNLNVSAKLFPYPVTPRISAFEGADSLFDLSTTSNLLIADTQNWAKAVVYWNQTRGINLSGLGINKEPVFDYLLDYRGDLYTKDGDAIVNPSGYELLKGAKRGGYLGKKSDNGLTPEAKQVFESVVNGTLVATDPATGTVKKATVKTTPTGWLRVRDAANLNGTEIAKVNTGESYAVLEDGTDWVKIKVSDTVSGWVSKAYVDVK